MSLLASEQSSIFPLYSIWKWSVPSWLKSVWKRRLQASRQQEISHQEKAPLGARSAATGRSGIITLIALPLLWIGFFHSLFTGNEGNMSSYSLVILMFSLLNADVLIKGEKLSNKVLDVLAKTNCVLLFLWAAATIVHVLVK